MSEKEPKLKNGELARYVFAVAALVALPHVSPVIADFMVGFMGSKSETRIPAPELPRQKLFPSLF